MKVIKMICKAIDTFTEYTGRVFSFFSLVTLCVIIYEVFMRRILNSPQIWTMDMICMSFGIYVVLIAAFGFQRKAFVCVDVVYAMLPKIAQHVMHVITYVIFFVPFAFKLTPVAWRFFLKSYQQQELGYSVWQPVVWPVKLALFVGLLLLCIQGVSEILNHVDWLIMYIRNGFKNPDVEDGLSAAEILLKESGGAKLETVNVENNSDAETGKEEQ